MILFSLTFYQQRSHQWRFAILVFSNHLSLSIQVLFLSITHLGNNKMHKWNVNFIKRYFLCNNNTVIEYFKHSLIEMASVTPWLKVELYKTMWYALFILKNHVICLIYVPIATSPIDLSLINLYQIVHTQLCDGKKKTNYYKYWFFKRKRKKNQ